MSANPIDSVRIEAALRWARPLLRQAGGAENEPQFATLIELAEHHVAERQHPAKAVYTIAPADALGLYHVGPQGAAERRTAPTATVGSTLAVVVDVLNHGSVPLPTDVGRTGWSNRLASTLTWLGTLPNCGPLAAALVEALSVTRRGTLEYRPHRINNNNLVIVTKP